MTTERRERIMHVLQEVARDVENDVKRFEGAPFNGKTVAEYFGCQAAAIKAVADILLAVVEDRE